MKAIKVMLVGIEFAGEAPSGKLVLVISKMSRLFAVSEKKVFSVSFPFFVQEDESLLRFYAHSHPEIDSKVSSEILSLLEMDSLLAFPDILNFAEIVSDACQGDELLWGLLRDLLTAEDGYVRYDFDEANANGHIHPIHHLDVFYSNNSTFKLGLPDAIGDVNLADILDLTSDCHYLRPTL